MNTERINEANAKASGRIATETINKHIDLLANKYAKTMKLDGFRKGKVPVSIVKTRYKDSLLEESRQQSINEFFSNAIKALNITEKDVIGQPLITKFEEHEDGIEVELKIGITPDFSVDNAINCMPKFELEKITDEQVEERLKQLAKNRAPIMPSEAKELKSGHIAHIDFEGFLDGKAFDGGKAEKFDLTIGSNQFIPGFEDALIGMGIGEEKMIDVTFPENYQAPNLAGKAVQFKVKLHAIKQKDEVAVDDAFAKAILGDKEENTLTTLKDQIRKDLEMESKMKLYNEKLKEEALENIAKAFTFDLPENILEQEMNVLLNNEISAMKQEEVEALKDNQDKVKELREAQRPKAETSVRVTFVVDKLAKQEKINVDDNEVFQTLYYESMMSGQNPQEVIEHYRKNNLLPAVKMAIIEDRVITHLLDKHNGINK
ncbi:trigger factor [Helicobacter trogontum]|uniref:Trigger factor n=1 Tax=Helicobacter trogontum TaxID=50960 RepID=A0A4U8TDU0_9HELI|nr:trigger factor [Helicobacter trogontum]MCI5786883.1 trigger factor [Helicobacter trogontum]MDY5185414.1 trigger factor [Helicobacter trogontum]TLD98043.1 trigger factor [Helicobacter trogontum]